ncbi:MAG: hypothetical protein JKX68_04800 [Flavobacteriales bacterium]|nr:hypothetical protein [Flavobacteriales bacterium]
MNRDLNSPISDSRHHNPTPNSGKKPQANKLVFIAVAILIFLMGLSFFLFTAVSPQPEEQTFESVEVN